MRKILQKKNRPKKTVSYLFSLLITWGIISFPFHAFSADESVATPNEYLLKAVCMYNFTRFANWPAAKDLNESEAVVLGVVGESPFGDAIRELQNSLVKRGMKNIRVIYYGPYQEGMNLRESHLLFISPSERANLKKIFAGLKNEPVLTVSDTDYFLASGGMISLVLLENRVRWEINRSAIEAAGIKVSAKLLQLAIKIENTPDQSGMEPYDPNNWYHRPTVHSFFASYLGFLRGYV